MLLHISILLLSFATMQINPFATEDYHSGYASINRNNLTLFYWLTKHRD